VEEAIGQKAAELARFQRRIGTICLCASHDLQEPLRKIQAFGDRLKGKFAGRLPRRGGKYLERMQNAQRDADI